MATGTWRNDPSGTHEQRYFTQAGTPTKYVRDKDRVFNEDANGPSPVPDDLNSDIPVGIAGVSATRFCESCGKAINVGAMFCSRCGAQVTPVGVARVAPKTARVMPTPGNADDDILFREQQRKHFRQVRGFVIGIALLLTVYLLTGHL